MHKRLLGKLVPVPQAASSACLKIGFKSSLGYKNHKNFIELFRGGEGGYLRLGARLGTQKSPLHLLQSSSDLLVGCDGRLVAQQVPWIFLAPGACSQQFEMKRAVPGRNPHCWKMEFRQGVVILSLLVQEQHWLLAVPTQDK